MEGLEQEAKVMAENIEQAEKVVIIGGGPVGFELAGEIFDKYKQYYTRYNMETQRDEMFLQNSVKIKI